MKRQEDGRKEIKRRFQFWVKPSTLELVCRYMEDDNCSSQSEFIEKAVLFYTGYLSAKIWRHSKKVKPYRGMFVGVLKSVCRQAIIIVRLQPMVL